MSNLPKDRSGNPHGSPEKDSTMAWSIRQMLIEEVAQKEGLRQARIAKKRKLVDTLYQKASGGDMKAMQLILQYHDGMPKQNVDMTTQGEKINQIIIQKFGEN